MRGWLTLRSCTRRLCDAVCKDLLYNRFNVSDRDILDKDRSGGTSSQVFNPTVRYVDHGNQIFDHLHIGTVGLHPERIEPCVRSQDNIACDGFACDTRCAAARTTAAAEEATKDTAATQNTGCNVADQSATATTTGLGLTGDNAFDQLRCRGCLDVLQIEDCWHGGSIGHLLLGNFVQFVEFF